MVAIGSTLGPYEISALAGRGGMGEVYRARDSKLKRTVAIKVLPAEFAHDPDRAHRFQQEAEALAALNHPNIAAIYALEEANATPFLVMEFVEGETLAERLTRGPLRMDEVVPLAQQICGALAAAHDRGIVHRDLKPANIKIAPDGQVKLLDFGLARMFAPEGSLSDLSHSPTMTAASVGRMIAGTAAYMAPEQARGKPVDKRADIWALGCVLYEMLNGLPAFTGETVTDILAAVVTQEPPLDQLPATTTSQVRWVIGRCLQKDPALRLRDAADAAALLSATIGPAVAPSARARWPWIAAALAVIAVFGAGGAAIGLSRSSHPRPALVRFDIPVTGVPLTQAFAVSPDGQRVVFVGGSSGGGPARLGLWLRSLDALEARLIDGTETSRTSMWPAWSPDSRSIAFVADKKLKKIDVTGGSAETLAPMETQIGGITWNRDGVILFASNDHGLQRVPASGGPVTRVTERDATLQETYHDCPVFLPDGRHFLYLAYSEPKPENRAIYAGSLDSTTRTRIMSSDACVSYVAPGFLVFPRGRTLMARPFDAKALTMTGDAMPIVDDVATYSNGELAAFAASDGGTLVYRKSAQPEGLRSFVWYDRNGKASEPLGQLQAATGPVVRLSPDDKRVVFSSATDGSRDDIWTFDLERNVRLRLTTDPDVDHVPAWSPDASHIVFDSHRGGRGSTLYTIPANGASREEILLKVEGTDFIAASDWSRDGKYLVFHRSPGGTPPWSLWGLPLNGERKPFLYKGSSADYTAARFSPNGRWLAYTTNESGSYEVVVQPFPDPSGGKWQVSANGGLFPAWRRDGRELYYVKPSGELVAVSVNPEAFAVGASTTLFRSPLGTGPAQGSLYDATSDGQRFLFAAPTGNTAPPMTTLLNWTSVFTKADR